MRSLGVMLLGVAVVLGILLLAAVDREVDVAGCVDSLGSLVPSLSQQLLRDLCLAIWTGRFSQEAVVKNPDWPWRALLDRNIEVGMSGEMVKLSWGYPRGVLRAEGGEGLWVYWGSLLRFDGPELVAIEELPSLTASELAAAYAENEIAAETLYEQKPILLRGTVSDLGQASGGRYYISFAREDILRPAVYCYFPEAQRDKLSKVNRGDTLLVFGTCAGKSPFWGQVELEGCIVL